MLRTRCKETKIPTQRGRGEERGREFPIHQLTHAYKNVRDVNGNDCLTSSNHIHTACAYCCTPDTKPALYFSQTLWSTNKLTVVCVCVSLVMYWNVFVSAQALYNTQTKRKRTPTKNTESCKNACSANGLISIQMCNLLPKWNAKYIKRKNMHSGGLDCLPAFLACLLACCYQIYMFQL